MQVFFLPACGMQLIPGKQSLPQNKNKKLKKGKNKMKIKKYMYIRERRI